ncbi:hypothetical protein CAPTEDRAFT_141404 [Capitella teleta]|uniref:Uncharacterized protein n=1 Tax=Capitella teleta TaxID=283909 RepID=R7UJR9_CAPTE|nr:hypothetical protein CAPTEDRAFT_141404 [Capitella teleta]|eukprot:ELU06455.1 hypothetical protein CAPTEDRAFT_141404 [Capitella teleta]
METGECLTDLEGHSACVNTLHILQDKWLISAGNDEQAMVWNLLHLKKTIEEKRTGVERALGDYVSCTIISKDGSEVLTSHWEGDVKVWDAETGKIKRTLPRGDWAGVSHSGPVTCVAVSGNGAVLASGGMDDYVRVWMLDTKQLMHVLSGHTHQISSVALSFDGQWLVSASQDKSVILWSAAMGQKLTNYYAHYSASKVHVLKNHKKIVVQVDSSKPHLSILNIINIK